MSDEPIDDRLGEKWVKSAQQEAVHVMMERFLTEEGRKFFATAQKTANKSQVEMILDTMHQLTEHCEQIDQRLTVREVAAAWLTVIQATIASSIYRNEQKSWEN